MATDVLDMILKAKTKISHARTQEVSLHNFLSAAEVTLRDRGELQLSVSGPTTTPLSVTLDQREANFFIDMLKQKMGKEAREVKLVAAELGLALAEMED